MSKFCPKCGEELVDNAKFCKNCGASLENIPNPTQTSSTGFEVPTVEKQYTGLIIVGYILAILIPLFGLIAAVYLLTRESANAKKHGKYILIVAIVVWFLSFLTLFH